MTADQSLDINTVIRHCIGLGLDVDATVNYILTLEYLKGYVDDKGKYWLVANDEALEKLTRHRYGFIQQEVPKHGG